jgi:hypothetical protein
MNDIEISNLERLIEVHQLACYKIKALEKVIKDNIPDGKVVIFHALNKARKDFKQATKVE